MDLIMHIRHEGSKLYLPNKKVDKEINVFFQKKIMYEKLHNKFCWTGAASLNASKNYLSSGSWSKTQEILKSFHLNNYSFKNMEYNRDGFL